jgi:hypothetical protein
MLLVGRGASAVLSPAMVGSGLLTLAFAGLVLLRLVTRFLTVTSADFVRFLGIFTCLLPEVRRLSSLVSAMIVKESPGFVCFKSPNQQSAIIDPRTPATQIAHHILARNSLPQLLGKQ